MVQDATCAYLSDAIKRSNMLSPKDFLLSIGALPCSAAHKAMQLYADYCIKQQSTMLVKIETRKKQSDHKAAFEARNKKGVDEFGIEWIVMQERVLKAFDHIVERGESGAEVAFVKDLVSNISYTILVNRK